MKKYFSLIFAVLFIWSILGAPFIVSAHDSDGIYFNRDLINGLNNYRSAKLYWIDNGDELNKPISSMTVTTNGKSYKDNGSEEKVSAIIEVETPITIDFSNSSSDYDIAEVGLQITNGTGEKMDWSSLPNGNKEDTAYASQYPFSRGKVTFTPKKPGTYKIYGEVRADIDRSQVLYNWDVWSHNGSHGEYADMQAHRSPPAGETKAYPVKWYFEVVVIKVVDKIDKIQGSVTVKYIDSETGKEIADPVVINNLPEGTHKSISAPEIKGYYPDTYKKWAGDESQAKLEKYESTLGIDITKEQFNWTVNFMYKKVPQITTNGGEISLNIIKIDGLDKFGYDPQWAQELYKGYEGLGYTYGKVFDIALMDKGCYPKLPWNSQVNFDNIKAHVENARKYRAEVCYNWNQTYHDEWKIIGSHEESYTDINGESYTSTVNDYGWVKVADPPPTANVSLNTSASGNVTTQISYNIASGEDAAIETKQISSNDSTTFQINAGEKKSFEFKMPLFSKMYPNAYESFTDNDAGAAIITATTNTLVPSKNCSTCSRTITYNQPTTAIINKSITIMPAKVYDHYMHLGE